MRKKYYTLPYGLLSVVLLIFFLSPAMAEEYPLEILGQKVTDANKDKLHEIVGITPGADAEFRYLPAERTLVMKNMDINVADKRIITNTGIDGLKIRISGKNTLNSTKLPCRIDASTSIEGDGELSITTTSANAPGIFITSATTLTLSEVTLNVSGGKWGIGGNKQETLIINDARLKAQGTVGAIDDLAALTLKDAKIIVPEKGSFQAQKHAVVDQYGTKVTTVNIEAVYDLYILEEQVTKANCDDLSKINPTAIKLHGEGQFAYNHKKRTLTIKNVEVKEADADVITNKKISDLKIFVSGNNSLKTQKTALVLNASTALDGNGALSLLTPKAAAISIQKECSLEISNLTLNVEGKWGIVEQSGSAQAKNLTIRNTTLTVKSSDYAIGDFKTFSIQECAIIKPENGRWDEGKHAIVTPEGEKAKEVKIALIKVERVELEPKSLKRKVGEEWTFTAKVYPTNATNTDLSWSSSDPKVATIDNGLLKAVGRGKTTITVTTKDGGHTDQCQVTVIETFVLTKKITGEGTLTLTGNAGEPLKLDEVLYGTVVKVVATPAEAKGYVLKELKANNVPIQNNTFTVTANTEVEALFALKTFAIEQQITGEGTLTFTDESDQPLTPSAIPYGTVVKVVATPEETKGYVLKELKANGLPVQNNRFTMTAPTTVTARFEKQTFSVSATVKENKGGTIQLEGADNLNAVEFGTTLSVKAFPETENGYQLKEIWVNGNKLAGNTFTVTSVTKVEVVFEKQTFAVTAQVKDGMGGFVALSGAKNLSAVEFGTELTVVTMPQDGFSLKQILVNDQKLEGNTFVVKETIAVTAEFEKKEGGVPTPKPNPNKTFRVTLTQAEHGTLAIEGYTTETLQRVPENTVLTVLTTHEAGYQLKHLLVNQQPLVGNKFTVTADTEVTALFKKQTFAVTAQVKDGLGGFVALSGAENLAEVEAGTELTVVTMPAKGYVLAEVQVNGTALPKGTMTFTVTGKSTVTVLFEKKEDKASEPQAVEDALLAGIVVAPNPFTTQLRIVNPEGVAGHYEVLNLMGSVLRSGVLDTNEVVVDTEALPSGLYFVRLEAQGNAQKTVKLLK